MSDGMTHVAAAVVDLLCEMFPRCFTRDEAHRRPLKIGIHRELRAALNGVIGTRALSRALDIYVESYRPGLKVGTVRIDLNGEPAGITGVNAMNRSGNARRWSSPSSTPETLRRRCTPLPMRSLKYRRAMRLLAKAIGWADVGESTLVRVYVLMGLLCGSAAAYAFLRLRLRLSKDAS